MLRRLFLILAFLIVPLCGGARAADDAASKDQNLKFGFLEKWVGEVPTDVSPEDPVMKPHPAIWDDPALKEAFLKALGPKRLKQLADGWGKKTYLTLVAKMGPVLAFQICTAIEHGDCGTNLAITFINMNDGSVHVCWEDKEGDTWLSSEGQPQPKPSGYCNKGQGGGEPKIEKPGPKAPEPAK